MLSRVFPHASIGRGRGQLSAEKSRKRCVLARPFALDGKRLGCFCEVRFAVFSSWPLARIVLGNTTVRSEICGRLGGGSAGNNALLGKGRRLVHDMQCVQTRINTGYFAISLIWRVGTYYRQLA